MTHTSGPYQPKGDEVWAGDVHLADCNLYAYAEYFLSHESLPGNAEDNAVLFAAVSDLLTRCEAWVYWWSVYGGHSGPDGNKEGDEFYAQTLTDIAKAKGEEPKDA